MSLPEETLGCLRLNIQGCSVREVPWRVAAVLVQPVLAVQLRKAIPGQASTVP